MTDAPAPNEMPETEDRIQDEADPRLGAVVNGKYRIVRVLGRGGMGSVYEARHTTIDRRFAVKFLLEEYALNSNILRRFEKEAIAAGHLEHPNLAAVIDFGRAENGAPYLVMEYLGGCDCAKLLQKQGPLSIPKATNLVYQACLGLAVAHRADIVHRDLKPENLFVTDAGDGRDLVKVLDFGIAKLRLPEASVATGTGVVMGTFYYMSPEQVRDSGEVDLRTDIWALGVVLYELLSGQKPFVGTQPAHIFYKIFNEEPEPLAKLRPDLPMALTSVVERAMKKAADERYGNVTDLAEALAPFTGRSSSLPALGTAFADTELPKPALPVLQVANTSQLGVATLSSVRGADLRQIEAKTTRRWWLVGLVGALLVAMAFGIGWRWTRNEGPHRPVNAASIAVPSPNVPATAAPEATAAPSSAPNASSAVAAPPKPSESPKPNVRTKSGHREPTSNKPSLAPAQTPSPLPIAAETPKNVAAPRPKPGLQIDKTNPF